MNIAMPPRPPPQDEETQQPCMEEETQEEAYAREETHNEETHEKCDPEQDTQETSDPEEASTCDEKDSASQALLTSQTLSCDSDGIDAVNVPRKVQGAISRKSIWQSKTRQFLLALIVLVCAGGVATALLLSMRKDSSNANASQRNPFLNTTDAIDSTSSPSVLPSETPSIFLQSLPTDLPSYEEESPFYDVGEPTELPTASPTGIPSRAASTFPTYAPTVYMSSYPSSTPSDVPSTVPSTVPSSLPSKIPSNLPSSGLPSLMPTNVYTAMPSESIVMKTSRPTNTDPQRTIFYAVGDVPYSSREEREFSVQMRNIPRDADFVIHVGDIRHANKSNRTCLLEDYRNIAAILRRSHAPVFIVLGDNEWNDCRNIDQAWDLWHSELQGFASRFWHHSFDIQYQPGRPENFYFVHNGSLFIGLNLVGGSVHNRIEWNLRLTDQFIWTREIVLDYNSSRNDVGRVVLMAHANPGVAHNDFFVPLRRFIANELQNKLPFLHLNGDKHEWSYDPSFMGQRSAVRIMLTGGSSEPPVKVTVNANGRNLNTTLAFPFDRRLPR